MKVPTYQKQAERTNQSGGMRFTVSASPDQFSQVASSQINLFSQLESSFTKLYENEVKVEREGALAKAKNDFTQWAKTQELLINNMPKEKMLTNWNATSAKQTGKIANKITDKVVQKRFLSWASSENTTYLGNISKLQRSKAVDEHKTNLLIEGDKYVNDMINNKVGSLKYLQAKDKLFSDKGFTTVVNGKTVIEPSIKQKMIGLNLMTAEGWYDYSKKTRSKIGANKVRKLYSQYNEADDSKSIKKVLTKLQDPLNGDFRDIDAVTKQSLIETGLRLEDTIDRRIIAQNNKQLKDDKEKRKSKHAKNASAFLVRIEKSKREPSGSDTTKTEHKMPTALEIITAYEKDAISETSYKYILGQITGDDAINDNPDVVVAMTNELGAAESPAQIDDILQKYQKKIGRTGGLKLSTYNAQVNMAQQYKDNTPFSRNVKIYRAALLKSIGEDKQTAYFNNETQNPDRDARAAQAITNFTLKISDPLNPVSPQVAFFETLENWRNAVKADLQTTMISPKVLKKMNLQDNFKMEDVTKWTPQMFLEAIDAVKQVPNRDINSKNKVATGVNGMTAVEKAMEIQKIKLIMHEVEMEKNAKSNEKDVSVKTNENNVGENTASDDKEKGGGWINRTLDLKSILSGGENKVEELKKKQNPAFPKINFN